MSSSKSPSSRRRSNAKKAATNASAAPAAVISSYDSSEKYRVLFNEIDSDNSGYIDKDELFVCISKIFPSHQVTRRNVKTMISNADFNHDGKVSFDEFVRIVKLQAGTETLWGRAEKSLWAKFQRGIDETIGVASDVVESAAEPHRQITRKNSYPSPDGNFYIAEARLRFISELIYRIGLSVYGYILREVLIPANGRNLFTLLNFIFFNLIEFKLWSRGQTLSMWLWGLKCVDKDTGRAYGFNKMLQIRWLHLLYNSLVLIAVLGSFRWPWDPLLAELFDFFLRKVAPFLVVPFDFIALFIRPTDVKKDTDRTIDQNEMPKPKYPPSFTNLLVLCITIVVIVAGIRISSLPCWDEFLKPLLKFCNQIETFLVWPTFITIVLLIIDTCSVFGNGGATMFESMVGAQVIVSSGITVPHTKDD